MPVVSTYQRYRFTYDGRDRGRYRPHTVCSRVDSIRRIFDWSNIVTRQTVDWSSAPSRSERGVRDGCGESVHLIARKCSDPHRQECVPIGRIRPLWSFFAAYTDSQRSHTAMTRLCSRKAITPVLKTTPRNFNIRHGFLIRWWGRGSRLESRKSHGVCANR